MTPIICKKCGNTLHTGLRTCMVCFTEAPSQFVELFNKFHGWLVLAGVFFVFIGYLFYVELTMTPEEREARMEARISEETHKSIREANEEIQSIEQSCADETAAFVWSQDFIREKLKSPSTAKFPSSYETGVSIKYMGNCTHKVFAYVDSQNGFGATIRTKYYALMQNKKGTSEWSPLEINFLND